MTRKFELKVPNSVLSKVTTTLYETLDMKELLYGFCVYYLRKIDYKIYLVNKT